MKLKKWIYMMLMVLFSLNHALAQCFPDRHNTNWFDGWISCETAPNPNPANGDSHWILYDFQDAYPLGVMQVWNLNDLSHLDYGLREVRIEYSLDGQEWVQLGSFEWEPATGRSVYEGFEGPDFGGALARYVLITGISNHGGSCFGLSEIRIAVDASVVPVALTRFEVDCASVEEGILLKWTVEGGLEEVQYQIEKSKDAESWDRLKETEWYRLEKGSHTFHYIDNGQMGASAFYRLISRFRDGREDQSRVRFCSQRALDARVYPNPMTFRSTLEILSVEPGTIQWAISDVYGRELYHSEFEPGGLNTHIRLDDLPLEPGQYFIRIRQGESERTLKLIRM